MCEKPQVRTPDEMAGGGDRQAMIADWKTNTVCFSSIMAKRHRSLFQQLTTVLHQHAVPVRSLEGTADIWARDYCPIQVDAGRFVKFRYYPDYLRGPYENLITGDGVCTQLTDLGDCRKSKIILDGGNVVSAESEVVLTDKVFRENPHRNASNLEGQLAELLEVDRCIFIPEDDDPFGHSDGLVRFLTKDLVVVNDYSKIDPVYGRKLRTILRKSGLHVERLPFFDERRRTDGIDSAVGNYVNFLRVGDLILLPAYGVHQDEKAFRRLERLCPQATIVPIPCTNLARRGGILNCVSWTIRV